MLFRYTCHQCGATYYPLIGPATLCPECHSEPNPTSLQVVAWFLVTGGILLTTALFVPWS